MVMGRQQRLTEPDADSGRGALCDWHLCAARCSGVGGKVAFAACCCVRLGYGSWRCVGSKLNVEMPGVAGRGVTHTDQICA
jgi:hypothetical protein